MSLLGKRAGQMKSANHCKSIPETSPPGTWPSQLCHIRIVDNRIVHWRCSCDLSGGTSCGTFWLSSWSGASWTPKMCSHVWWLWGVLSWNSAPPNSAWNMSSGIGLQVCKTNSWKNVERLKLVHVHQHRCGPISHSDTIPLIPLHEAIETIYICLPQTALNYHPWQIPGVFLKEYVYIILVDKDFKRDIIKENVWNYSTRCLEK